MLISGKWSPVSRSSESPALTASRVIQAFENERCEVARRADGTLEVTVPGLDAGIEQWLPLSMLRPLCRPFWDRMDVRVDTDGSVSYRARYGSAVQLGTHGLLVLAGALELSGGAGLDPWIVLLWLFLNVLPAALTVFTLAQCRARVLQRLAP
jgi:hypothetical protein